MYRLRPITARLRQKIRERQLEEVAQEVITFDTGRTWTARPLLHPEGELDRLEGHHADSDPAGNMARIECKEVPQGATKGYLLRDAIVADGSVMTGDWARTILEQPRRKSLPAIELEMEEAALCSTPVGERYFGHWLRDQLPLELLASDRGHKPIAVPGAQRPNEPGYRDLSGFEVQKPIAARFDKLWIFDDHEITDHRVDRIARVRDRLRGAVAADGPKRVFLSRGKLAVGRGLVNEAEIAAALRELGFETVEPETMSVSEIVRHFANAEIVVGPEGSAFAHALMALPQGATLIQIQGAQHFNLHYRIYAEALGMRNGFIFGQKADAQRFAVEKQRLIDFVTDVLENSYD